MSAYKHLLFLAFFLSINVVHVKAYYQALPELTNEDFGFKHPMLQATTVYYHADKVGYEPTMLEFYRFNKNQNIELRVLRIFGKYKSETTYNYVYKNGLLDSLNTIASAANFSNSTHYSYNSKKQMIKSICTGKYANFTDEYSYNSNGKLTKIIRNHKNGGKITTNYFYKDEQLERIEEVAQYTNQPDAKTISYYVNGKRLASAKANEDKFTLYQNDFGELTQEVEGDVLVAVRSFREDAENPDKRPSAKPFLKSAKVIFQANDTQNMDGDWIKRYQIDNRFVQGKTSFVFRQLKYANETTSGATKFDALYEMQIKKRFNLEY